MLSAVYKSLRYSLGKGSSPPAKTRIPSMEDQYVSLWPSDIGEIIAVDTLAKAYLRTTTPVALQVSTYLLAPFLLQAVMTFVIERRRRCARTRVDISPSFVGL